MNYSLQARHLDYPLGIFAVAFIVTLASRWYDVLAVGGKY